MSEQALQRNNCAGPYHHCTKFQEIKKKLADKFLEGIQTQYMTYYVIYCL